MIIVRLGPFVANIQGLFAGGGTRRKANARCGHASAESAKTAEDGDVESSLKGSNQWPMPFGDRRRNSAPRSAGMSARTLRSDSDLVAAASVAAYAKVSFRVGLLALQNGDLPASPLPSSPVRRSCSSRFSRFVVCSFLSSFGSAVASIEQEPKNSCGWS